MSLAPNVFSTWPKRRSHSLWQPLPQYIRSCPAANECGRLIPAASELHRFLRENEWRHLYLSSMFVPQQHDAAKRQELFCAKPQGAKAYVYSSGAGGSSRVAAMLLWAEYDRLLFDCRNLFLGLNSDRDSSQCAGALEEILPDQCTKELKRLLQRHLTRQFIGTSSHYEFLLQYHDFQFERREYWMMVRKPDGPNMALTAIPDRRTASAQQRLHRRASAAHSDLCLPTGLRLERLGPDHFGQLLPLEQAYYVEERLQGDNVTPAIKKALEKYCARRLEKFLQYGIFARDQLVARAMINAYGLYYWQIGGIYTVPDWRRQGLAHYLLQKICSAIEQAGRSATLFVRLENENALGLYYKNSFECLDMMVIAQESIY